MKRTILCVLLGIIFMVQSVCVEAGGKDKVGATTAVFLNIAQGQDQLEWVGHLWQVWMMSMPVGGTLPD